MPDDSTIPDEAVKAATKAIKLLPYGTYYKDVARAALTAAYPHLVAELDHVAWQRDDFRIAWNDVAKIVEQRNHQLDEAEHEVARLRAQLEAVRELVGTYYDANHADWVVTRTAILAALGEEEADG
jgi:predicted metalloendopeptidase